MSTHQITSIHRALDEVGDKWCLLLLQELFWGINSFSDMLAATGASRAVLSKRLSWLQQIGCVEKRQSEQDGRRQYYQLTQKGMDLYPVALMAINWERAHFSTPELDEVSLVHQRCGKVFEPSIRCQSCLVAPELETISFQTPTAMAMPIGTGKLRRRASESALNSPSARTLYKNLIAVVGERWSARMIAEALKGASRFEEFSLRLPMATNVLSERLRVLQNQGILYREPYQQRPVRYRYSLTRKGRDLLPWYLALQQWGDRWYVKESMTCSAPVEHVSCSSELITEVVCDQCQETLHAHDVSFYSKAANASREDPFTLRA